MKYTIEEWIHVAHNQSKVSGFHTGPDGNPLDPFNPIRIASRLALIHSELSEALEEIRKPDRPNLYRKSERVDDLVSGFVLGTAPWSPGYKPEGLGPELADVAIRVFDLAGSLDLELETPVVEGLLHPVETPDQKAAAIQELHRILDWYDRDGDVAPTRENLCLQWFLSCVFSFAKALDIDLWRMIEIKHEYNTSRPYKHGKVI